MQNKGKYGEDFSKAPTKAAGESPAAYAARLKDWQRRRSMSGSSMTTAKKSTATTTKIKESSGSWMDKVVKALK